MNGDRTKTLPERQPPAKPSAGQQLLSLVKHVFLHNGWFKLCALLISVTLWAGLISQDASVTRDKVFTDVSVNVTNTDTMKRNGYIVVSNMDELLDNVNVTAAVPQTAYDAADVSTYNVRLDLGRISGTGTQELRLQSSASSTFGRVTSISPASVSVMVEDYVVRYRIPVSVTVNGEIPSGWYMSTPTVDAPLVVVSGPRSLVNSISRARVFLNPNEIEWEEGTCVLSAALTLYNRSGEEVHSNLLEISYDNLNLDSVVLETTILPTRSFDVTEMIGTINNVPEGYEVKAIHISPETITVAGRSEVLDQMTELATSEHYVDLNGLTDTTSFQIKVSKPSEDAVLSNDTITVTVEVVRIQPETETP